MMPYISQDIMERSTGRVAYKLAVYNAMLKHS